MPEEITRVVVLKESARKEFRVTTSSGTTVVIKRSSVAAEQVGSNEPIVDNLLVNQTNRGDFHITRQSSNVLVKGGQLIISGRDKGEILSIVQIANEV